MEFEQAKSEYNILFSKYQFNNISFKQVNTYEEIDVLINNINNIPTEIKQRKYYDYTLNLVYLYPRFWNFCKKNQTISYFSRIKECMSPKQLKSCLLRFYEYYVNKLHQTDKEVYDEVKIIAEQNNRSAKRLLINIFIKKWTQTDKNINITL